MSIFYIAGKPATGSNIRTLFFSAFIFQINCYTYGL